MSRPENTKVIAGSYHLKSINDNSHKSSEMFAPVKILSLSQFLWCKAQESTVPESVGFMCSTKEMPGVPKSNNDPVSLGI